MDVMAAQALPKGAKEVKALLLRIPDQSPPILIGEATLQVEEDHEVPQIRP